VLPIHMEAQPGPSFERRVTATTCGAPDRVPIAEITVDKGSRETHLGQPANDLETDVELYAEAGYDYITLARRVGGELLRGAARESRKRPAAIHEGDPVREPRLPARVDAHGVRKPLVRLGLRPRPGRGGHGPSLRGRLP